MSAYATWSHALARGTAAPALAFAGWLVAVLPLLLAGIFRPLPALLIGVPVAALVTWWGVRRVPAIPGLGWGVLAVAGGFLLFNGVMHGEQLILRRDPASYAQYAIWLAGHGSLPIPADPAAFGGPDPSLVFESMAFYRADGGVSPQFMPGYPLVLAVGSWLGGVRGLLLMPPLIGALAVLVFGGVVARLVGPRWAVLGAGALAVSLPLIYTGRTTLSEPLVLVLLFGGIALVLDAVATGSRVLGLLGGLTLGLSLLVRIDGLRDVLPAVAYAGLLIALPRRRRVGVPLAAGLFLGAGVGFLGGYLLAGTYLKHLRDSLNPLLLLSAAVVALTSAAVLLCWDGRFLGDSRARRVAGAVAAALAPLLVLALTVRPWVQQVRRVSTHPEDKLTESFIGHAQRANGLAHDPTRLYTEYSMWWVIWYVGLPLVVLGAAGAAVLLRRLSRGREARWLLPLAVVAWTTVATLLRPAITPDHPWATRRLVPVVIPGMILLGVWGLRWLLDRYGMPRRLVVIGVVTALLPIVFVSARTAFVRVNAGEVAAMDRLCRLIPPNASVLIVERVTADRFTQVVRGMCGVPTARLGKGIPESRVTAGTRVVEAIRRAGRVPVVLGAEETNVTPYGRPVHAISLRTRQDERSLVTPPDGTYNLRLDVWLTRP
ncbi:hypothetical protein [Bailinhaonella thermotolerans]|uniref:Glycosyltransferase RgtA/B/C/D-like domain-containing protein n=1 Tax=Bailinhaonella thermotolerans TaxID=1070861 RepID=A0A3A4ANF5_9ACTN|nr:hypothetical protein [Bailinhaonella thermotolerans]RJL30501.1 hypothetical protein D5H75_23360 [Bailinhaonella thermotolerans]